MQQEEGIIIILGIILLVICYFSPITTYENFANILIKPDGVILGGYVPQILRPFDDTTPIKDPTDCKFPCYSNLKHQEWCDKQNAIKYHAMRPLINSEQYNKNLEKLFNKIKDNTQNEVEHDKFFAIFCSEKTNFIMDWLMKKIEKAVTEMPEMKENSSWIYERFFYLEPKFFEFENFYKIIFYLYNLLRSTSTLVEAVVFVNGDKLLLKSMNFVNEEIAVKPDRELSQDNLNWNYKNTLEIKKFNKYGFHDPYGENIEIKGGIPEKLLDKITNCKNNLSVCYVEKYTGFNEKGPVQNNGNSHFVYNNPNLIMRDAKIESYYV